MSKSAQLKRKAAEFEQKRQYDRALASYVQAIEAAAGIPDELDIPLYNRVGDLHLRLGDLDKAVSFYETAVDLYAEGGFFNNAIALCNKVLRHSPDRTVIYYKLGKISARKGFNSDAKQNFLEYASRTEKAGDVNEAFRALKEFADLCPGQDDVRLMLAEQLARAGKTQEALEQLQIVHEAMLAEDRVAEANATLERIRGLDPSFAPRAASPGKETKREGLVFLDVDYGKRGVRAAEGEPKPLTASVFADTPHPLTTESFDALELPQPADEASERAERFGRTEHPEGSRTGAEDSPLAGLTPADDPMTSMVSDEARGPGPTMDEFESTSYSSDEEAPEITPLDIEHTSFEQFSYAQPSREQEREEAALDASEAEEPETEGPETEEPETEEPETEEPETEHPGASIADALTEYVSSFSEDVAAAEGGLPGDLAILPPEAIDEEQAATAPAPADRTDDDYVDLNEWLLEGTPAPNPRMTADEEDQSKNQVQTDFSEMLETFKAGVAANVDESDSDSHYDLGVAYLEMGLFDEAIAQFQKVMRADTTPERRVRAYEALGQSFIEKDQFEVALSSLEGGLKESGLNDTKLVGVLYLLGYASERLGRWHEAEGYYRRVFAVDIHFRDVAERLKHAEQMA